MYMSLVYDSVYLGNRWRKSVWKVRGLLEIAGKGGLPFGKGNDNTEWEVKSTILTIFKERKQFLEQRHWCFEHMFP